MASGILRAGKYTSKLSGPRVSPGVPGLTEPLVPKPKRSRWSAAGLDSDDYFSSDSESGSPGDDADYGEEEDSFASEELLQASMTGKEIVKTLGVVLLVTSGMAASVSNVNGRWLVVQSPLAYFTPMALFLSFPRHRQLLLHRPPSLS